MFSILDQPQNFFSSCFTEVLLQCCYGVLKLSHNETVSVVVFYLWTAPGTLTSPVYFKQIIIIPAGAKCTASCVADDNSPRKRSLKMLTVLQTSDLLFTEKVTVKRLCDCVNFKLCVWTHLFAGGRWSHWRGGVTGGMCVWREPGLFTDLLSASRLSAGHCRGDGWFTQDMDCVRTADYVQCLKRLKMQYVTLRKS